MNISSVVKITNLLQSIGHPARLQILLAIGDGDVCVCHLEATFGWRQVYLSQHLMALRKTGLVLSTREGRNIHYRLTNCLYLYLIQRVANLQGVELPALAPSPNCGCPNCRQENESA